MSERIRTYGATKPVPGDLVLESGSKDVDMDSDSENEAAGMNSSLLTTFVVSRSTNRPRRWSFQQRWQEKSKTLATPTGQGIDRRGCRQVFNLRRGYATTW